MLAVPGKPFPKYEDIIINGDGLDDPEIKAVIDFESAEGEALLDYLQNNTGRVRKNCNSRSTFPNIFYALRS